MNKVLQFLNECKVFFVASTDGDQPRVRPFGAVAEFEGRLYFCTNNQKKVYQQLRKNPRLEISGCTADNRWLRLSGRAVFDDSEGAKAALFAACPALAHIYQNPDNPVFTVFHLAEAQAIIENMAGQPTEQCRF